MRRGASGPDGRERHNGPRMARVCRPPERHRREGEFRAAKPGCRGAFLFGYFLLGTQEKVTRREGERGD